MLYFSSLFSLIWLKHKPIGTFLSDFNPNVKEKNYDGKTGGATTPISQNVSEKFLNVLEGFSIGPGVAGRKEERIKRFGVQCC
jgi:hypothetical protein